MPNDPDWDWDEEFVKARDSYLRDENLTTGQYAIARDAWNAAGEFLKARLLLHFLGMNEPTEDDDGQDETTLDPS